jgi:hypothetical protein
MKKKIMLLGLTFSLINFSPARACGLTPDLLAQSAVSTNEAAATSARAALRRMGEPGLAALLKAHAALLTNHWAGDPHWQRLRSALDVVGGQRDCHASRLFWHTNFSEAQAEAERTGKPVLSLRLLGKLDEELSCANSRFFRTTLYANREVSDYLRNHFVLHWKSVRPVPRITIDMGDGRKIERTITGNSIHYVLDVQGRVVDALPGLYGPRAFLDGLRRAEDIAKVTAKSEPVARAFALQRYHTGRLSNINSSWENDLRLAKAESVPARPVSVNSVMASASPNAVRAMPLAEGKSAVEMPMLRAITPRRAELERSMDDDLWAKIAALHKQDGVLDAHSVELIRAKTIDAKEAMRLAFSKSRVEDPMLKTIQNLQRSISEDTVRNEYTFHAKIHEWLATADAALTVDSLNTRVYAELFLTPDSDPWLGLAPADTYSALDNGGLVSGVSSSTKR